jgi:hypothetical protein
MTKVVLKRLKKQQTTKGRGGEKSESNNYIPEGDVVKNTIKKAEDFVNFSLFGPLFICSRVI